jgi:hypothetical protein
VHGGGHKPSLNNLDSVANAPDAASIATLFYTPKLASFQTGSLCSEGLALRLYRQTAAAFREPAELYTEGSRTFGNALINSDSRLQFGHAALFFSDSNCNYRGNTLSLCGFTREFAALLAGSVVHRCVQSFQERYKAGNNRFLKRIEAAKPEAHRRGIRAV